MKNILFSLIICFICYSVPLAIIMFFNMPILTAYIIMFSSGSIYMAIMLYKEHKQDLNDILKRCATLLKEQEVKNRESIASLNDDIQKYIKRARNAMYEVDEIKGRK